MGIHYYFQVTLNDYTKEELEPNVPSVEERIETFKQLSDMVGKERVIWRFDPLIITPTNAPREILTRKTHLGNKQNWFTIFIPLNGLKEICLVIFRLSQRKKERLRILGKEKFVDAW